MNENKDLGASAACSGTALSPSGSSPKTVSPASPLQSTDAVPGHWDTAEGRMMAREYASKERGDLMMGEMSDLALANAQYMVGRDDFSLIHFQTAAKERIRWLSVQLAIARGEQP